MKYTQFVAFSKLLENNNYSIDDFKNSNTIKLYEADEEKDEEKPDDNKIETKSAAKDLLSLSPKKALMRRKLNNFAKNTQDSINKNINDKLIKPLIEQKSNFYKKIAEFSREKKKTAKEVVEGMKGDIANMKKIQDKQLQLIEKTAETILDVSTKKINAAITKKLKESDQAEMIAYWAILSAQIMSNLLNRIYKINAETLKNAIEDPTLQKTVELIDEKTIRIGLQNEINKYKKEADTAKTKLTEVSKKLEKTEKDLDETKTKLKDAEGANELLDKIAKKAEETQKLTGEDSEKSLKQLRAIANDAYDQIAKLKTEKAINDEDITELKTKLSKLNKSIKFKTK
jgi:hypothetical protein